MHSQEEGTQLSEVIGEYRVPSEINVGIKFPNHRSCNIYYKKKKRFVFWQEKLYPLWQNALVFEHRFPAAFCYTACIYFHEDALVLLQAKVCPRAIVYRAND